MSETIIIPIPEGFTKKQVFEILADANNYQAILKREVLKEVLKSNLKEAQSFSETVNFKNAILNKDGTYTVIYSEIEEYDNPISKYDYGVILYGAINRKLLTDSIEQIEQKEFKKVYEESKKKSTIDFDGLIIT